MLKKIDGKKIAEKVKDKLVKQIYSLLGRRPSLAIILVGKREDSKIYVSLKEREAKKVGIDTHTYYLDETVDEKELIRVIDFLNQDDLIDAILLQLPLPEKFSSNKIINTIKKEKDVDGFRLDHPDYIISPVMAAIKASLKSININENQKTACLLYNSEISGQEIKKVLKEFKLKILDKKNLSKADVLITALGKPEYIKKDMVKKGVIIIDIGITKKGNKVYGDCDFNDLQNHASYITPVPGGIGPMTIAFLFKNVLEIYNRNINK
jgi:methylenetetrahydrofolate dehydrogenase (NADP+) / methenyltetrahydrofolate cyclohydrolase